ncbi:NUDIX domain-containing protein [Pseudonocardia oroxyli]|uniref:ADP-ribose pyrophosphatase YjhB, NUDIX family n=1 Tax=Pseudonocardia oroxyli TaxID=366584 RepID=A0A1G7NNF0_PSEOR|nr:NUDIX domain-containing protein [Pseudonocardia oroxyli]SDF75598.1 ADP-ribose pyrophosphatase YjhB, NUDIX family [Pseudonocardia oroxyli]
MSAAPLPHGSSGDGWQWCAQGHKHWGLYGAAGLLVRSGDLVLLQHRALWSHHGGTWGIPGGARHLGESAEEAARREAAEESELDTAPLVETARFVDDHGGWSYTTVVVGADEALPVGIRGGESVEFQWFRVGTLGSSDGPELHPGFAHTWPQVRDLP